MLHLHSQVAGTPVAGGSLLTVRHPYDRSPVGTVVQAGAADTAAAVAAALAFRDTPSRYERSQILDRTRAALESRREEFARTISLEA
ncbi:MAG: aldehyde dehydrogenase family protein, partial [Verrucomicrobiae bacterium]|nr:aldehyde dehydrogenase family protein [Verrucomicrobiae bacterium]